MADGQIRVEDDGQLRWLILDNPERLNALNSHMWRALAELVQQADASETVRVVLLRGEGQRAFSAGADISEFDI